jgi:formylglycine-generating enzyme required for sulfatase activity
LKSGELKQRPVLTNDAYVAAGGVAQAINQDAQDCFQGLPAPQQAAARRLFLRLVRPGEGSAHLRQRAALPEDRVERAVVTAFAKPERRLLFVGDRDGRATVEVAHEALIRGWPTLLDWVEASREKLRTRADVLVWREQNARPGMPPEPIPAGVLLSRARELLDAPGEVPVDDIRDFIGDSAARVDRAASEELRKQKRRARAFGALAALAGAFAMGAGWFWWQADDQRRRAEQNFAVAEGAARTLIDGLSRGRDAEGVPLPVVQGILEAADGGLGQLGAGGEAGILDLRASGLTELGLTRWYRADWPGAQAALEQALAIRRQLAAAAPDDPGRRSDIATVQERLAEVFEAQGAMPTAFAALQAALAAREAASRTRPATADPLRALLRSLALLVDLARRNGDDAEARGFAQRALAVGETLRDLPGHAAAAEDWQQAVVLGRRAGLLPATGTDYPAKIGGVFRDCADCPPMVVIPPGRFRIGSTDGDPDERKGPEVTVNTLAVGRHEITFAEYDACVAAGGCTYRPGDWGWGRGQRPVILVTWHDANAYARWLSARTGQEYRLLTESEWEYAARGRTDRVSTRWFWGDDPAAQCRYANGADQTARDTEPEMAPWRHIPAIFAACADGHGHTSPVGTFDANGFGLFDMAGNVWEWVQDCYVDNYRDLPADGSARREPATCASRVLRGGSWGSDPRNLRSADRFRYHPDDRNYGFGFRVARTPG